jgi:lipopolysaccharide transport system ATP-binding protein
MSAIVEVRNISKQYRLGATKAGKENFREFLLRKLKSPLHMLDGLSRNGSADHFWALRDINFDVAEGEVLGIIGRNGAGKSTLLKILSRITDPTEGYVHLRGRVASLLEVGTGFHSELTGRENIFLNGAILGMSRGEIISKFDEIVAFSEVDKFLDTPVKHYSSGMYVRLAFAVAANLNPEILVVDEVLAVGDIAFQKKCLGKMSEVSRSGRTVLFVSHNMATVENLCQHGIVLDEGKMAFAGTSKEAVRHYLNGMLGSTDRNGSHQVDLSNAPGRRRGSRQLLRSLEFCTDGDRPLTGALEIGGRLKVKVHFNLENPTDSFNVGLGFNSVMGTRYFTAHSFFEPDRSHGERVGPQVFVCDIPSLTLMSGDYTLKVWLDVNNAKADEIEEAVRITILESDFYGTGKSPWNGAVVMRHNWYLESPPDQAVEPLSGKREEISLPK